jgi:hypothetical protein
VAALADVAGEHFKKYHDFFMPTILQIVVHCKSKEQRKLRGQAINCISMIGLLFVFNVFYVVMLLCCYVVMLLCYYVIVLLCFVANLNLNRSCRRKRKLQLEGGHGNFDA